MNGKMTAIAQKAQALREQFAITGLPVNMFRIVKAEKLKISFFVPNQETASISGLLDKDKKIIYLNMDEAADRQNFTLAHELAHYFLGHKSNEYGVYHRDSLYRESKPEKEREADYFAAELLMPANLIDEIKEKYALTDSDAPTLARLFGVSTMAMKRRLKELSHA